MYYPGPAGYPQPGARGPMPYGPGAMPRPRYYAPPAMGGMPPMGAPYGQVPPQQFNGQYPPPPPGARGVGRPPVNGQPGQQAMPNGAAPIPRAGGPVPPNAGARPPQAAGAQGPRGAPAAGARPGGYKVNRAAEQEQPQQGALTAAMLANAAPAEQKQMLGEALYPKIHASQPELAGKITGMLLEMDSSELLYLIEVSSGSDTIFNRIRTLTNSAGVTRTTRPSTPRLPRPFRFSRSIRSRKPRLRPPRPKPVCPLSDWIHSFP